MTIGEQLLRERIEEARLIAARVIRKNFPGLWRKYDFDDLLQDAMVRILTDAHNYDPAKGSFSTFVGTIAHLSVLHNLQADRCQRRKPEKGIRSLDEVIWSNNDRFGVNLRLGDVIADPMNCEEQCIDALEYEDVLSAIELLPDARMKKIIQARYMDDKKRTLGEVGRQFGLTRERIRQIEGMAFQEIRRILKKPNFRK